MNTDKFLEISKLTNPVQEILYDIKGKTATYPIEVIKNGLKEWFITNRYDESIVSMQDMTVSGWGLHDLVILDEDTNIRMVKVCSPFSRGKSEGTQKDILTMSLHKVLLKSDTIKFGIVHNIYWGWSPSNLSIKNYPKTPTEEIKLELQDYGETLGWIKKKLSRVESALSSGDMPECPAEKMWYDPKKKVYQRCEYFCSARHACLQFRAVKK